MSAESREARSRCRRRSISEPFGGRDCATIGRVESYIGARIPLNGLLRMLVRMAPAYGKASSQ
ncbi:hypothetical protein FLX27_25960 [Agrobacterium tumefaciens]|nr:hypothetical protein CFBP6625_25590 [Agrobacterium tumefaciens]TQN58715.1 hypothetical protein FLX27_25960 [Agrobacterium tumefaciens]